MKPAAVKFEFIRLRAEGRSQAYIAKHLSVSRDTCLEWDKQFKAEIAELKGEQLRGLYHEYYMTREARIKRLGTTLNQIAEAANGADLGEIAPDRLLDAQLKYSEALKAEYIDLDGSDQLAGQYSPQDILNSLGDLLQRIRTGGVTPEQAGRESAVISNILKTYETVELQSRVEAIEAAIDRRGGKI